VASFINSNCNSVLIAIMSGEDPDQLANRSLVDMFVDEVSESRMEGQTMTSLKESTNRIFF